MNKFRNKFLSGPSYDSNRILQEYSLGISNITNQELLADTAIGLITEEMEIKSGYLFEVEYEADPAGGSYRLAGLGGKGRGTSEELVLQEDNPLVDHFHKKKKILSLHEINALPGFSSLAKTELDWFTNHEMVIFVPVYTKDEWIGLITLGQKNSGKPYTENDLILIRTLGDLLSLALQNARLVGSLLRVNNDYRRAYTAMEQSNRHLQMAVNQLERMDKTKSDFISIASHELRTPLTVMRGYTEMLIDDASLKSNAYHLKLLKGIHTGITRLHEIVDSMLDMANIDARSLSLHKDPVSVQYLVRSVSDELKPILDERNLTLTTENLRDLPMIEADHEAMGKVLRNLLGNAIKYTPDGGKITVSGVSVAPGQMNFQQGGVEIIISDTGIGIPQDDIPRVFERFYRVDKSRSREMGGTGLGLAIAKHIVQLHHGDISVQSKPGTGSMFTITLPR